MNLNRFELLNSPLPDRGVTAIIRDIAGGNFDIQWNQTMILLAAHFGRKVWQHIIKNCIH
jgi:hypothetical protein